jgi:tetratricopeptide (TPR) repeat protein
MKKGIARFAAIAAAWALLSGVAFNQSNDYQAAVSLFQEHQWRAAAAAFEVVEKSQPGATDAQLYLGKCYTNLQQFDTAFRELEAYAARYPKSADAAYLLAFVRFRQDKPAESLHLYTAAARLKTPESDDLKVVALDYVLLSDYRDAAHYLEIALQMDPNNVEARYHLGRVRYQQNQFDDAIATFRAVLQQDPNNIKAEYNLGLSLEGKDLVPQAIAAYRQAIKLEETQSAHDEQPYLDLGILLSKSNRSQEAVPLLEEAASIAPKSAKIHYELGKAYFNLTQLSDAEREAEAAVRLNPDDAPSHYLLGRIYHRVGKPGLATKELATTEQLMRTQRSTSSGMATGGDR